MAGFFRKLFGKEDDAEGLQKLIERSQKWQVIGAELAHDCLSNGLRKGEIVKLSDITNLIHEHYSYNEKAVENGFLVEMKSYIDSGEVLNINVEGGDMAFVHEDYAHDLFNK
ncbi:hypothetical protein [Thaumasiovibrio sp. DFM-14]|uniref:hypothetical protein n=1 Tax=Thaumasiovibrio sp. DFM-14 TaxID=3384792 RepID=UPI0039A34F83